MIPSMYHSNIMAYLESEKRGSRRTPLLIHTLAVHALAVNIDMVCELSAALLCLCKKLQKICEFIFSVLRFHRHHHTERFKSCCWLCKISKFYAFVMKRGTETSSVSLGVGDDETHISWGDNLLETVSRKSSGAHRWAFSY